MQHTLDRELAKEIRQANGDGSREAKFALLARIRAAAKDMSSPEIKERFSIEMCIKHGRAVVAICVASTLWLKRERIDGWQLQWARDVLDLWTTRPRTETGGYDNAYIDDQLHPTAICEYAAPFINGTTEYSFC